MDPDCVILIVNTTFGLRNAPFVQLLKSDSEQSTHCVNIDVFSIYNSLCKTGTREAKQKEHMFSYLNWV